MEEFEREVDLAAGASVWGLQVFAAEGALKCRAVATKVPQGQGSGIERIWTHLNWLRDCIDLGANFVPGMNLRVCPSRTG